MPYVGGLSALTGGTPCKLGNGPPDADEVFEGLGHFEAGDGEVAGVQEVVDPLPLAARAIGIALRGVMVVRLRLTMQVQAFNTAHCESVCNHMHIQCLASLVPSAAWPLHAACLPVMEAHASLKVVPCCLMIISILSYRFASTLTWAQYDAAHPSVKAHHVNLLTASSS